MDLVLTIDGKQIRAKGQILGSQLWLHYAGDTHVFDLGGGTKKRKTSAGLAQDEITSPMPGKVTRVFVKPGQSVKTGDSLLVMEAMKMEYTMKAEKDSVVLEVKCQVNDQVQLGQILVKFEKAEKKTL